MLDSACIKRLASEAGFDLCGVTKAEYLPHAELRFSEWLASGYGEGLEYLYRNQELRFDASKLMDGAKTVVVCGVNYKSDLSLTQDLESGVGIASYALMRDYHKTIKKRLKSVFKGLQLITPELNGRVFTDSAPLLEKHLAVKAGLGWIGRQSLLITPKYGSFVLLGEILLDREVDIYDFEQSGDGCGSCRRCIEACPASAINNNRTLDTRLCIACRTIELEDSGDKPLAGWIFGCDICQRCCPHNQRSPLATNLDMRRTLTPPTRESWMQMDDKDFETFAQGTPIKRSSLQRVKHNIKINE
ncbi:MAG: tRNA epoxyqueuosine(34) reductase QueG [Rikenellaceae bacterium]